MHGRKRPFTVKNGDIRRSYTGSVHGHRIRSETDTVYGDRIKIWSDLKVTVCTPYTELYDRILSGAALYGYSMRHFSDSYWK